MSLIRLALIRSDPEPSDSTTTTTTIKSPWLLTQDLLQDGLRVLIAEEGLFHGGSVSGIRPPDIYGVVVDGERGSRPRILSTEELLHEAVSVIFSTIFRRLFALLALSDFYERTDRLLPGRVESLTRISGELWPFCRNQSSSLFALFLQSSVNVIGSRH